MKPPRDVTKRVRRDRVPPGIVILNGGKPATSPVIRAFVWGGRVPTVPTLPYGRWKPSAA